ncbi:MAG: four helix bundle protein [Bacteroidota bacterium]
MAKDMEERTFEFALRIVELAKALRRSHVADVLMKQLLRSGTSVGANIEKSRAGYSRDEFAYKMNISLKEARETHYWLRLLKESGLVKPQQVDSLLDEAEQIKKILGSIVSKTRGRSK